MSTSFTVIIDQRQHFGDGPSDHPGVFVGLNNDYSFPCRQVDPRESAILLFETLSVSHDRHFIAINSTGATGQPEVFGGIPFTGSGSNWAGNVMLVRPGVLQENNILRLGARASNGSILGNVDDFVIDNVVIIFKTRRSVLDAIRRLGRPRRLQPPAKRSPS
jgi:hypothetical protein